MIPVLQPIFQNEWISYGETIVHGPLPKEYAQHQVILLEEFLSDSTLLTDTLIRYGQNLKCRDLLPVASAWTLDYFSALLPPVVAANSVLHHGFPVSATEIRIVLDAHGAPVAFQVPHEGESLEGQVATQRYAVLVWKHLEPLIDKLVLHTPARSRLLWNNAARYFNEVLEQAAHLGINQPGIINDQDTLLRQPHWPDGRFNPLYGKLPTNNRLHRQCCLYYLLPDQNYCRACPKTKNGRLSPTR